MTKDVENKTPGTLLREARVAMSLSLEEAAAMTRIPRTMLSHLERDRFDEYSAEVFARGHIRNYARELRLDPERIIQRYEQYTGRVHRNPLLEAREEHAESNMRASLSRASRSLERVGRSSTTGLGGQLEAAMGSVRTSHLVAVGLVLVVLFFFANALTSSRATAKDPAQFPESDQQAWEIEQAADEARWALEQPSEP